MYDIPLNLDYNNKVVMWNGPKITFSFAICEDMKYI